MCHYQTLYHDEQHGYIVRCSGCEKIQLGFGNLLVTFGQDEFSAFRWWLRRIKDERDPGLHPTLRCIMIPTPCEGMKWLLSPRELDELDTMLEAADTELRSIELISLFNNSPAS